MRSIIFGMSCTVFRAEVKSCSTWEVEVEVDRLIGVVDEVREIFQQANHLKEMNHWDYVISLTDLPIFSDQLIVLADVDVKASIAQISLPAFGIFSTVLY